MATQPQQISSLQLYEPKSWAGLTTSNHLGTVFQEEPTLISNVMSRIFGLYRMRGLDYFLSQGMEKELPNDNSYKWYLKGDDDKSIPLSAFSATGIAYDATDLSRPGMGKSRFRIIFAEKWFEYTDLIIPDDDRYRLRIMAEPYEEGNNWVYEVALMTADANQFVPPTLLQPGKHFSKEYSPQSKTLNRNYGGTSYTSAFQMENALSMFTKKYVIPGNMHARPLVMGFMDPDSNKVRTVWTQHAELVFLSQWYKEKDKNLWYARANKNANGTYDMKDENGFPIVEGAGFREQISPSYRFNYTKFTIDYLQEIMLNMSINILPEDKRHFVAFTGERGMVQFHKALENKVAQFQPLGNPARLSGSGQSLAFGGQYVEYRGPQGTKFTLVHLPLYDDTVRHRIKHPEGGPIESYRYTLCNFGTSNGENNITRVYPRGRKENMWHVAGSTSPLGPKKSFRESSASAVDGYELFCQCNQGIMLKNPMSCAEMIYSSTV